MKLFASGIEKIEVEARRRHEECARIKALIAATETELESASKRHSELIEAWQVGAALSETSETKRPRELSALGEQIQNLRARRVGLRKKLVGCYESLAEIANDFRQVKREDDARIVAAFRREFESAIAQVRELAARGMGLESVVDSPEPLVPMKYRGERMESENGAIGRWVSVEAAAPPSDLKSRLRLLQSAEEARECANSLRLAIAKESKPSDEKSMQYYSLGLANGRAQSTQTAE